MFRTLIRIFLIGYIVAPVVAVALLIGTVRDIGDELSPLYDSANRAITTAADDLQTQVQNLRQSFQPLVDAVNALRSGLNSVAGFISDSVNAVIGWVRTASFGAIDMPRFRGITIPALVDLSFLNGIADNLNAISTEVSAVVSGTANAVSSGLSALVLVIVVFVGWVALSFILFYVQMFTGLWGKR